MSERQPTDSAPPFPWRTLLLWSVVSLVLRVGTNLTRVDENYAEGLYRGTLAKALVDGLPLWPGTLYEIPHVPGSFVISIIAVPFYWLFGPTTFALRMAGIVFHLAALSVWCTLLHRRLGPRVAFFGTALFALCPPGLAKLSVLSYGDHAESLPFFLAAAIFAVEWAEGKVSKLGARAFAAGFFVSSAVGFHLQGAVGILAVAATAFLLSLPRFLEARFYKEIVLGFLPGMAAGALLPFAGYMVTGKSSITLWGHSPTEHLSGGKPLEKFLSLVQNGFTWSLQYEQRWIGDVLLLLAAGCAAVLAAVTIQGLARARTTLRAAFGRGGFFIIYPAVFCIVYARSSDSFKVEHSLLNALDVRYTQPVVPFLLLPIAAAGACLLDSGRRALALLVLAPALAIGAYGSLSTWNVDAILHEPARRGFLWEEFDGHFVYASLDEEQRATARALLAANRGSAELDAKTGQYMSSHADPAAVLALARHYDQTPEWTLPLRYVAPRVPLYPPKDFAAPVLQKWLNGMPVRMRTFGAASVGSELARQESAAAPLVESLFSLDQPKEVLTAAARGYGCALMLAVDDYAPQRVRFFNPAKASARIAMLPRARQADAAFGLGFETGLVVNAYYDAGDLVLDRVAAGFRPEWITAFARGLGAGYRMRFLRPPDGDLHCPSVERLVGRLPRACEAAFRAGLGGSDSAE